MKNYSDQYIQAIKNGIEANFSILDQTINWANKNLKYDEKDEVLLKVKTSKNTFQKIYDNIDAKPVMAVFGGSQVGKSYLIKNLLSSNGQPFIIKNQGDEYDFLQDINPPGVGAESTGVVTRFTIDDNLKFADFPIQIKLLSAKDLLIIVLDSFFLDLKKIKQYNSTKEINAHLEVLEQNYQGEVQQYLTDFDILEIKDYFENHLSKHTILFEGLRETKFFERVGTIINGYTPNQWGNVFNILWLNNTHLNQLFTLLIESLAKLDFDKSAYIRFNEVLRGGGEILDVQRLKELKTSTKITDVKRENGQTISILQSLITALTAELIFTVPKELVDEKPFLNNSDLLDFPGARSRLAVEIEDIDEQIIPDMLLRGKVSYLFNKYSDDFSINNLLFCTNDKQLDVNEIPSLLFNWISKNIGENKIERSNALQKANVPPLFVIFTFFNNQLKFDTTNDIHYKEDQSSLNYKWDTRFNRFFKNEIVTQTKDWDVEWTMMNHYFQNFYVLRDFKYSTDTYEGFELTGTETGIREERKEYLDVLKNSFVQFDFVQKHFNQPELYWDEATSINFDGSKRIIINLNEVSNNYSKTNYYLNKLNEITLDLKSFLKQFIYSDDIAEIRANSMKNVNSLQFTFNTILTKDPNSFNNFLNILAVDTVDIYNLLNENIVVDSSSVNDNNIDQNNILLLQYPELKDVNSYDDAIEILKTNLWLSTKEEVETFLETQGIDKNKLFTKKESKSKAEIYSDLIFNYWKSKITNQSNFNYFTSQGLTPSNINFLVDHLFSIIKNRKVENKIVKILNDVISETENNRGIEEFLAESFTLIVNAIISKFDIDFFTKDEIEEIKKMPNYRQFLNFQKLEETPSNDLSNLFEEEAIINSEAIMLRKYNKWIEFLRISLLVNCGFVNYDEQANRELKAFIEQLSTHNELVHE